MIFNIKHLSGSLSGQSQRVALNEGQILRLGRNPESDIRFSETADDAVSNVHAELRFEGSRLWLVDQRSSNGTFLNGSPCPPFEKIAVPDGSRIRLAKAGPELQVTQEGAPAEPAATATAPSPKDSSIPAKQTVGRETLLREIDRAKQEERDAMVAEVTRTKRSTGLWIGLAAAAVLLVAVGALAFTHFRGRAALGRTAASLEGRVEEASKNVWMDVQREVGSSVAYIRCRYNLRVPFSVDEDNAMFVEGKSGGEAEGTGVLIAPGIVLTAKHVVEPWKFGLENWGQLSEELDLSTEYDLLDVQFPGQQPINATVVAVAENRDLALLSIAPRRVNVIPIAASNDAVQVTDVVGIIGYPSTLGQYILFTPNFTSLGDRILAIKEVQPTFLRGTVTMPVTETGESSHLFFLDASVEPGCSGGPVLSKKGEVIGIIAQRFEEESKAQIFDRTVMIRRPIGGSVQAISPGDIQAFLRRTGLF